MHRFSGAVVAAISAFALTQIASAADLPRKAPAYAPPPTVYNWTGFYLGLHAGYGWGTTTATDAVATNGFCWFACGFQWNADVHGFVGGGQVGYNWQFAPSWVVGVEGDIGYLGVKGIALDPISTDNTTVNTKGVFTQRHAGGLAS